MNQETAVSEVHPVTPIRNFSVLLSPTPRGARLGRLLATEQLRTWGLPMDRAAHVVAELAANAATHGRVPGRDFRLTLYVVADTLRIEVSDTRGDRLPYARHSTPDAESGRGLVLVDALADRWGWAPGPPPRKTVWAELDLAPEPSRPCSGATGDLYQETPG
ncbi:ATP-binding protein [Streptomyces sp. NBC_01549]|uniref:ATP-binding protein n=1 Tax=Streptomyces sp. NBC_01549 TaxID=2975874 RepID=UPI00224F908A|nr:ATP-binding protein [Streptomyces sp. NBC_01549]MCX4589462.1 ATP-binding protein [Streptomyces sp. NBC_01549]